MSEPAAALTASVLPEQSLFRIGEVARLTATKPFVLRYWETEFPMLEPVKSPSGHRLYRREDVQTVLEIRRLLYDEGFTIAGARRHLRERAGDPSAALETETTSAEHAGDSSEFPVAAARAIPDQDPLPTISRKVLLDLRDTLRAFLTLLETE